MSNAADDSPAIPRRGPNLAVWIVGAAAAVLTLVGFGAQFFGGSDSQSVSIEGDGNTVVGPSAEVEAPAGASAGTEGTQTEPTSTTLTESTSTTTSTTSVTTRASETSPTDQRGDQASASLETRTAEQLEEACGAMAVVSLPPGGEVEEADYKCPGLSGTITTPDATHEWQIQLTLGQVVSYFLSVNVNAAEASILDPGGAEIVSQIPRSGFGQFVAPADGLYTFRIKDDPGRFDTAYTVYFSDVTLPLEDPKSYSPAAFTCATTPILPIGGAPGGALEPGDDGCPVLSAEIEIPYASEVWRFELSEGQTISYSFTANLNDFAASILGPNGGEVTQLTRGAQGSFEVRESGAHVLLVEFSEPRASLRYELSLVEI